jgi:photosynthetic reaction center cytochrome c subunit
MVNVGSSKTLVLVSGIVLGVICGSEGQTGNGPESSRPAEEVYKNIQVLKGTPADQVVPAMQFAAASLGVECSFCHVEGALEKDDKKPKQTARKMIQMMESINRGNFDSKQEVTCFSCHRGQRKPLGIPIIQEGATPPVRAEDQQDSSPANTISPEQILSKYVQSLGGASGISQLKTRQLKGSVTLMGRSLPVDIITTNGGRQVTIIHLPNGDNATVYNGTAGWTSSPNRGVHSLPAVEVASARVETDIQMPLHAASIFAELKVGPVERVADRDVYLLLGINAGEVAAKLYFDQQSGLLVRIVRYTRSPLGLNPTQIDYADYRPQGGVQIPFRQTISRPNSRILVQIEAARLNEKIDDAIFARPAAAPGSEPR